MLPVQIHLELVALLLYPLALLAMQGSPWRRPAAAVPTGGCRYGCRSCCWLFCCCLFNAVPVPMPSLLLLLDVAAVAPETQLQEDWRPVATSAEGSALGCHMTQTDIVAAVLWISEDSLPLPLPQPPW